MIVKPAGPLRATICRLLEACDVPEASASAVAESLVLSNLKGHDSHGVIKVPVYLKKIDDGELKPGARAVIAREFGATATVDAGWGFGQVSGRFASDVVARLAAQHGVGTVAVSRSNHVGRVGEYVERLADRGLVGCVICSGANPGGSVAPYGGAQRLLGTNPIAWGIPRANGQPAIVADFATSAIAAGKLDVYRDQGVPAPEGVLLDSDGWPTRNPEAFVQGGALLPFGGQKGYALMLVIEILATLWTGFAPASSREFALGNPMVLTAWDSSAFVDADRFHRLVEELVQNLHRATPQEGFQEVLLPGEPEQRIYAKRSREGIPIPETTWAALRDAARSAGVDPECANQ